MRRWPTWLLAGALVALGAVAAADALRESAGDAKSTPAPRAVARTTAENPQEPNGVLYYSDAEDDCRLHGVGLPQLENAPPPKLRSCEFSLAPDGTAAVAGDVAWSPRGGVYARESARLIELGSPASAEILEFPGRAPAFKPDGTLTYVLGNTIVELTSGCPPRRRLVILPGENVTVRCRFRLLGERRLRRILPWHGRGPISVNDMAWFDDAGLALVIGVDRDTEIVAIVEEGGAGQVAAQFPGLGHTIETSPRGASYALWRGTALLAVRDRNGGAVRFPPSTSLRAVAWSPDDRWIAAATEFSVFLFRTDDPDGPVRRLPFSALDLAWH
jgi:hypothetical protein